VTNIDKVQKDIENLVHTLKRRVGYQGENKSKSGSIIGVNLQAQNNTYYVTVHYSTGHEVTKSFGPREVIQAIGDFLKCEEYIGKTSEDFELDFDCRGSIRY